MFIKVLLIILFIYLVLLILEGIFSHGSKNFDIYFGVPGSGKTTMAAWLSRKYNKKYLKIDNKINKLLKKYKKIKGINKKNKLLQKLDKWRMKRLNIKPRMNVFSNVPIKYSYKYVKDDIGIYNIENSLIIFDEASVDYNNRNFKTNLTKEALYFWKFHRHYGCSVAVFSQSYDDMDVTLRRLATRFYLMNKSIIPFFISRRYIKKKIGIDKETKQVQDQYKFAWFGRRLVFSPKLWKLFNSYDRKELKEKKFELWK